MIKKSSLPYHIDELAELLNHDLTINFLIASVTESRLRQNKNPLNSIDLPNYNIEYMPTKSDKGGALYHIISYHISYHIKIPKLQS